MKKAEIMQEEMGNRNKDRNSKKIKSKVRNQSKTVKKK